MCVCVSIPRFIAQLWKIVYVLMAEYLLEYRLTC